MIDNLGIYIKSVLEDKGVSQRWLACKINVDEKKLSYKLNNDSLTGMETLKIGKVLGIRLDELKEQV